MTLYKEVTLSFKKVGDPWSSPCNTSRVRTGGQLHPAWGTQKIKLDDSLRVWDTSKTTWLLVNNVIRTDKQLVATAHKLI